MKFHVIKSKSFFGDTKKIDAFHAAMFHATADRGGKRPNRKDARLAYDVDRPLQLHKNAYEIAPVFEAEGGFVVSSDVRQSLVEIPHVAFAPVHFKTLFHFPYREGDFSFHERIGHYDAQMKFIDERTHDASLKSQVGEYFELIAPPLRELRGHFEPLKDVSVKVGSSRYDFKDFPISQALLLQHPIYSCGSKVMSDPVFEKLRPFINWTYFVHGEGSI